MESTDSANLSNRGSEMRQVFERILSPDPRQRQIIHMTIPEMWRYMYCRRHALEKDTLIKHRYTLTHHTQVECFRVLLYGADSVKLIFIESSSIELSVCVCVHAAAAAALESIWPCNTFSFFAAAERYVGTLIVPT